MALAVLHAECIADECIDELDQQYGAGYCAKRKSYCDEGQQWRLKCSKTCNACAPETSEKQCGAGDKEACAAESGKPGQAAPAESTSTQATGFRFGIGDVVMVKMGRKEWKVATVTKINHREPDWPAGQLAPYMVNLERGGTAYVPNDDERLVRRATDEDIVRVSKADELTSALGHEADRLKAAQLGAADALQLQPDLRAVLRCAS